MGVGFDHASACACAACADHQDHVRANANIGYAVPTGGAGDGLIGGKIWAGALIRYGFPTAAEDYDLNLATSDIDYGEGEAADGFAPLNAAQISAAEAAIAQIAAVSQIAFQRDDAAADIRLAQSAAPTSAWAYLPDDTDEAGDVWLGTSSGYYGDPARGGYAWHTFLHEIGHAVGLKHGHEGGAIGAGGPLAADQDTMEWSVMTYRSYVNDPMEGGYSNESAGYAQSLMRADIAALQQLYGANYDHNAGDTIYAWRPDTGEMLIDGVGQGAPAANRVFQTIWDGGGADTIDASAYETGVSIDLTPGAGAVLSQDQLAWLNRSDRPDAPIYASANVYFADLFEDDPRALIENATGGAGADDLTGNSVRNVLIGGAGDDHLVGRAGDDRLVGGEGRDRADGGAGADRLVGQTGADTLSGGEDRDSLIGGGGRDALSGDQGRDRLIGGGGADTISGGGGADLMTGGGGADVFQFSQNSGRDRITDFRPVDRIDLTDLGVGFSDLVILDKGHHAAISIGAAHIMLLHVDAETITADDFLF